MYKDTTKFLAKTAELKFQYLKNNPVGFFISCMMAGAYVGVGIVLILSLGNEADPSSTKLIMGTFFGITLTLIIFAGAELFSGHIMFMTFGFLYKRLKAHQVILDWVVCWYGNLLGAITISVLFALGGGGGWINDSSSLVHAIALAKINSTPVELIARGIICNWLVCLAIWMTTRTENDTTKCILIFWCLFAFVAAGFEHGIANMTVFTVSMMGSHPEGVNFSGILYNLFFASVGNTLGGAIFIGGGYYLTDHNKTYE
ncbi:MAG: formate/nitrite transporter family protein [Magnetovibrio sp.]|nr:formate/nitrite transporter family protein [Magnetovibrio sp.]